MLGLGLPVGCLLSDFQVGFTFAVTTLELGCSCLDFGFVDLLVHSVCFCLLKLVISG